MGLYNKIHILDPLLGRLSLTNPRCMRIPGHPPVPPPILRPTLTTGPVHSCSKTALDCNTVVFFALVRPSQDSARSSNERSGASVKIKTDSGTGERDRKTSEKETVLQSKTAHIKPLILSVAHYIRYELVINMGMFLMFPLVQVKSV